MSNQTRKLAGWSLAVVLLGNFLSIALPVLGVISIGGWIATLLAYMRASEELSVPELKDSILKTIMFGVLFILTTVVSGGLMAVGMVSHGEGIMGGMSMVGMLIGWVFLVCASWFWYKANTLISRSTGIGLFKVGGLMSFTGTVLLVIMVGGLLILIGHIVLIVAWFSLPEESQEPQPA